MSTVASMAGRETRVTMVMLAVATLVLVTARDAGALQRTAEDAPCSPSKMAAAEEALDAAVEERSGSEGMTLVDGVQAATQTCRLETAAGDYEIVEIIRNAPSYWDVMAGRAAVEPGWERVEPGWERGLEETGIEARADELVVEDDELIIRIDTTTWFFGFGSFGADPTEADRRKLVGVAAELVGRDLGSGLGEAGPGGSSPMMCLRMRSTVADVFEVSGPPPSPSRGGGVTSDGEPTHQYMRCRFEPTDSDLRIDIGIGDEATFEGRRPSGLTAPPRRVDATVGDAAWAWRGQLMVRAGDAVFLLSGRTDDGEIEPGALVPLAGAVVRSQADVESRR